MSSLLQVSDRDACHVGLERSTWVTPRAYNSFTVMNNPDLSKWGLAKWVVEHSTGEDGLILARVIERHHNHYKIVSQRGTAEAVVSDSFVHEVQCEEDFPAVGDWVWTEETESGMLIQQVLPRRSFFIRRGEGSADQTVAANIDIVFICMALNGDFSLRKLERYLALTWDSLAVPVIVLTKADLCAERGILVREVQSVAAGCDILICSSHEEQGFRQVLTYLRPEVTVAFIGDSGAGKTTLVDSILGEELSRDAHRNRQLTPLEQGGVLIDTSGLRKLVAECVNPKKASTEAKYHEIRCRFADCTHTNEPGCAVRLALEEGVLDENGLDIYQREDDGMYGGDSFDDMEERKNRRACGNNKKRSSKKGKYYDE